MLVTLVVIYIGIWLCASAAAQRFPGRLGFVSFYLLAVLAVPLLLGLGASLILERAWPGGGAELAATTALIGAGMGLVFYPIHYWQIRRRN